VGSAVEQAVGQAVEKAVQSVLIELMTNPDVLALLRAAAPPSPSPPEPAPPDDRRPRGPGVLASAWNWATRKATSAARACASGLRRAGQVARLAWGVSSTTVKVAVVAGAAAVAGAAYAARKQIAAAASAACGWARGLAGRAGAFLAGLLPAACDI
jgi:hypothetical protein